MPASSQASREFSQSSLTTVRRAFVGESYPRICLFRSKNSEIAISRCFFASSSAMDMEATASHPFGAPIRTALHKTCRRRYQLWRGGPDARDDLREDHR